MLQWTKIAPSDFLISRQDHLTTLISELHIITHMTSATIITTSQLFTVPLTWYILFR